MEISHRYPAAPLRPINVPGRCSAYMSRLCMNVNRIVSGTCTSNAKKLKLEEMGFNVHKFNANEPELEVLDDLSHHTHLLVSVPPVEGIGDPLLQHDELLKRRLVDGNLRWLCYLSSTSVYGNCGGAWVDEDYPVSSTSGSAKAKARLAAEEGWLQFGSQLGLETKIFRLGGIYGPGRSLYTRIVVIHIFVVMAYICVVVDTETDSLDSAIDTILKQKQLSEVQRLRSFSRYTSRVHISDICQALHASIQKPSTV
uniref:NAD-dependent epimerase/dehydratase domain-containing protein n=1 Tax=Daucus carota subsp. sativus TaxID=79200 RepID=A0A164UPR0_DAUCS